jgi:hypothetical protein
MPLAVIIVVGLTFYLLGGKTRQEPAIAAGPAVSPAAPVSHREPAP